MVLDILEIKSAFFEDYADTGSTQKKSLAHSAVHSDEDSVFFFLRSGANGKLVNVNAQDA